MEVDAQVGIADVASDGTLSCGGFVFASTAVAKYGSGAAGDIRISERKRGGGDRAKSDGGCPIGRAIDVVGSDLPEGWHDPI